MNSFDNMLITDTLEVRTCLFKNPTIIMLSFLLIFYVMDGVGRT